MGFANYAAIIAALTAGKGQPNYWSKPSVSAVASTFTSLWNIAGMPVAGTFGTALTARAIDRTSTGAISFTNPVSPANLFLSTALANSQNAGTILFYDRLAEYPLTGGSLSGNFAAVALPARDQDGTTAGRGVFLFVENANASAVNSNVTVTITYTNSAGIAGRVMPAFTALAASQHGLANPTQPYQPLFGTDVGVRSIDSYSTNVGLLSSQINIVLARPLFTLSLHKAFIPYDRDFVLQRASLPRLYDGAAIGVLALSNQATSGNASGRIETVEG